jgi:TonB-linked SusC/RagA family outer membrane protein
MKNTYKILFITVYILAFAIVNAFGQGSRRDQAVTISSVVQDGDGNIVPNSVIYGNEGATEVKAGADGQFTISVASGSILRIEAKGYRTKLISAVEAGNAVVLEKTPFLMDDSNLVNVAYGKINKRETASAIEVVNVDGILPVDNSWSVTGLLNGRITSLGSSLNIRGMGNALVLIDGVPRSINAITADEVDQITVLKDVNATVLYGTQAKNGVILITTKRGDSFKRRIDVSVDRGFSEPISMPKYLGSAEYMELYNEALGNDGLGPAYSEELIANYRSGSNPYLYPNLDYYSNEFLRSSKPHTRFAGNFSGGNDQTQYYANIGWINSGTLYNIGEGANASENRLNTRANVSINLNDNIRSFVEGFVLFDIDKGPNGNFWNYSTTLHPYYFPPLIPVSMVEEFVDVQTAKLINGSYILGGNQQYQNNVYGNMFLSGYTQNISRTIAFNNVVEFDLKSITEGLTFRTQINIDMFNDFQQSVNNQYAVYRPTWGTVEGVDKITVLQKIGKDEAPGTQNLNTAYYTRRMGYNATLDYARTFNDVHTVTGTLLGYYNKLVQDMVLISDKPAHLGLRATYDYDKKYFANFSSAFVHSVRLAKGNRGAFSPTLGLGWVISEEDFLSGSSGIDYLKLRVSAGILNTDINHPGHNLYQSILSNSNFYGYADQYSNQSVLINRQDNLALTYEKVKTLNMGVEGYFFNNSLTVDANVFFTENSGQVALRSTYPAFFASFIPYENYNIDTYSGAELGMSWMQRMGDFSFTLGGNLLYATSKVKERDEIWQEEYMYRKGNPVFSRYGLEAIGFFNSQDEIDISPLQEFGEVRPGDIKYKDQNGDGLINNNDVVYLGSYQEKLGYGIHLTLKYKNLSLFGIGNGINGGDNMWGGNYFWVDGTTKYSEEVLNRWTPGTSTTATYPRLTTKSSSNNYRTSTFWLYDRSYFRINRVQLTYDLTQNIASRFGAKGLGIYLRGSNLLMLSENAEKRQLVVGAEPSYRSYAAGLRVNF